MEPSLLVPFFAAGDRVPHFTCDKIRSVRTARSLHDLPVYRRSRSVVILKTFFDRKFGEDDERMRGRGGS